MTFGILNPLNKGVYPLDFSDVLGTLLLGAHSPGRSTTHNRLRGCSQPEAELDGAPVWEEALDTGFASSSTETPATHLL